MNLVVDTNIVFSAILNPQSNIGDLILNNQHLIKIDAPEFLLFEIEKYSTRIETLSKQTKKNSLVSKILILNAITFISEELISQKSWEKAINLTSDIDEDDTPFVALAIEMNSNLWTGDKKLTKGLISKDNDLIITTQHLKTLLSL